MLLVKDLNLQRAHIVQLYLYEISRISKSVEKTYQWLPRVRGWGVNAKETSCWHDENFLKLDYSNDYTTL